MYIIASIFFRQFAKLNIMMMRLSLYLNLSYFYQLFIKKGSFFFNLILTFYFRYRNFPYLNLAFYLIKKIIMILLRYFPQFRYFFGSQKKIRLIRPRTHHKLNLLNNLIQYHSRLLLNNLPLFIFFFLLIGAFKLIFLHTSSIYYHI